MFTIEENALKCAICGLGVLEGGPMVGGSINNSIHPNCLLIDPFSDEVYTVKQEEYQECWICEGNILTCDCNEKYQEPCWVCGGKGFDNLTVQCPYCN